MSQVKNLPQRALQSVWIRHPWPLTSHRIRKNSTEKLSQEKKGNKPSGEQQRRIPLQDGQMNRCHVTRRNHYRVTTHSINMTDIWDDSTKLPDSDLAKRSERSWWSRHQWVTSQRSRVKDSGRPHPAPHTHRHTHTHTHTHITEQNRDITGAASCLTSPVSLTQVLCHR